MNDNQNSVYNFVDRVAELTLKDRVLSDELFNYLNIFTYEEYGLVSTDLGACDEIIDAVIARIGKANLSGGEKLTLIKEVALALDRYVGVLNVPSYQLSLYGMTSRVHDKYRAVSQASRAGLHRALDAANLNVEKLIKENIELKEQLENKPGLQLSEDILSKAIKDALGGLIN